jgi:hypothetical protein
MAAQTILCLQVILIEQPLLKFTDYLFLNASLNCFWGLTTFRETLNCSIFDDFVVNFCQDETRNKKCPRL